MGSLVFLLLAVKTRDLISPASYNTDMPVVALKEVDSFNCVKGRMCGCSNVCFHNSMAICVYGLCMPVAVLLLSLYKNYK